MGVPVAKNKTITIGDVEDGVEVGDVIRRAGGGWRHVGVDDVVVCSVDEYRCGDGFDVRVVGVEIDGSVGNGVMNEQGNSSSSTAARSILTQDVVAWNARILVARLQFSLLNGCDLYIMLMKELGESLRNTSKAIAVPLKERLRRR